MDAHFSKVLSQHTHRSSDTAPALPSTSTKDYVQFIPAAKFEGRRHGYKFKNGSKGVGYYFDIVQIREQDRMMGVQENSTGGDVHSNKRKLNELDEREDGLEPRDITDVPDVSTVVPMDASSLRQLLVGLEKKITKNQKMRMKFADTPERFMESEVELHEELQELFAVAASPELYPVLVQSGAVGSLLGLLTHENTDVSLTVISLLHEMIDADGISDELDNALEFINQFVDQQGLELLVQNLYRLNEDSDEDAQGVHDTLSILEAMVDLIPQQVAVPICEKTHILKFLLDRCRAKAFDANKLSCSELLSILLQADPTNQTLLCGLQGVDGMDSLLQCIAVYRKRDVTALDEQTRENQFKFLACEGFELLARCLKEDKYAAGCVVHALSYAVSKNRAGCEKLVDVGGLKYVFPLLTSSGVKRALRSKHLKKRAGREKSSLEDSALSIVAQLCSQLCSSSVNDYSARILYKFMERDSQKLDRCVDLFAKNCRVLDLTDEQIEETRRRLEQEGDEEELAAFEENIYNERLEGGLFNLQQLSVVLSFAVLYDGSGRCQRQACTRLASEGLQLLDVLHTLRGMVAVMAEHSAAEGEEGSALTVDAPATTEKGLDAKYKQLLTGWCALLASIVDEHD